MPILDAFLDGFTPDFLSGLFWGAFGTLAVIMLRLTFRGSRR